MGFKPFIFSKRIQPSTIFIKSCISDVRQGPEFTSGIHIGGGPRAAATSKMEWFVMIVNGTIKFKVRRNLILSVIFRVYTCRIQKRTGSYVWISQNIYIKPFQPSVALHKNQSFHLQSNLRRKKVFITVKYWQILQCFLIRGLETHWKRMSFCGYNHKNKWLFVIGSKIITFVWVMLLFKENFYS